MGILLGSVAIIVKVFSLRNEEHPEAAISPLKLAGGSSGLEELATENDIEITTIRTEFIEKIPPVHGTTSLQDSVINPPMPPLRGEVSVIAIFDVTLIKWNLLHFMESAPLFEINDFPVYIEINHQEYDSFPSEAKGYVSSRNFEPTATNAARSCLLSSPLLRNSGMPCRPRQSPDILGISSQLYDSAPNNPGNVMASRTAAIATPSSDIITPVISLAATNTSVVSTANNVISKLMPSYLLPIRPSFQNAKEILQIIFFLISLINFFYSVSKQLKVY